MVARVMKAAEPTAWSNILPHIGDYGRACSGSWVGRCGYRSRVMGLRRRFWVGAGIWRWWGFFN